MLIVFFPLKLDDSASVTLVSSRPQMFLPDAPINKRRSVGWPSSNLVSSLRFFFCFSFFFLSMATCVDKCHPMVSPLQAPRSFCWLVGWLVCLFVCLFLDFPTVTTPCRRPRARSRCVIDVVMARCHGNRFVSHSSAVCLPSPKEKKKSSSLVFFFRNWKHRTTISFRWIRNLPGFSSGVLWFSCILLGFTMLHWVLLGFTGFY